jgi:hypothetical protein
MCDPLTAPAEAYAPDADRAGPDSPAHLPEWLVHCLAHLILFLLEHLLAICPRRSAQPSCWQDRPDLPPGSAQAEAASIRGQFGNAIAWMCRRRGIGPGHPDWQELSRAIVAFGGSLAGFRAGAPARGLQWWENPNIVPGMIPAVSALSSSLLPPQAVTDASPPAPNAQPAEAGHALWPASWRQVLARAGTGPPATTGPPAAWTAHPMMPYERGQSMAGPAVLIRADQNPVPGQTRPTNSVRSIPRLSPPRYDWHRAPVLV